MALTLGNRKKHQRESGYMFEQSQVDKLYPGAKIYAPMKFWSLPKNKIHMKKRYAKMGNILDRLKKMETGINFRKLQMGLHIYLVEA